jgi:hypothetical protein
MPKLLFGRHGTMVDTRLSVNKQELQGKSASRGFCHMNKASLHITWNFQQYSVLRMIVTFSTAACNIVNKTLIKEFVAA